MKWIRRRWRRKAKSDCAQKKTACVMEAKRMKEAKLSTERSLLQRFRVKEMEIAKTRRKEERTVAKCSLVSGSPYHVIIFFCIGSFIFSSVKKSASYGYQEWLGGLLRGLGGPKKHLESIRASRSSLFE